MSIAEVELALLSGTRWIHWRVGDEIAARDELERSAKQRGWRTRYWTPCTSFGSEDLQAVEASTQPAYQELAIELSQRHHVSQRDELDEIWILLMFDPPERLSAYLVRQLQEIGQASGPFACITMHFETAPRRWPDACLRLRRRLPDRRALAQGIEEFCLQQKAHHVDAHHLDELYRRRESFARDALGLELHASLIALRRTIRSGAPETWSFAFLQQKATQINAERWLEPVTSVDSTRLGGFASYKRWLQRRKAWIHGNGTRSDIPDPRGALLLGIPGCGKSLAAQVTANVLELPLFRLDIGQLFGSRVGESESNFREVTELCEQLAPIVLWIDEIEKSLAGADAAESDGGTTARAIASLLTWLQERKTTVFVVATANQVTRVPPELLRRGRLDEVFFVDLPDPHERREICEAILARPAFEAVSVNDRQAMLMLVANAERWSGAEIESAFNEAFMRAYAESKPLTAADLQHTMHEIVPLAIARAEEIESLRRWGQQRARPVR